MTTDIVVNATGTWGRPSSPGTRASRSFAGKHVHTNDYTDASDYEGQDVIVVGGGTSAIGFLLELEGKAKSLTWVSRRGDRLARGRRAQPRGARRGGATAG